MCVTLSYGVAKMNQSLTIRISDNMRRDLDDLSKFEYKPVSDLVRESLQKYLAVQKFRKLRNSVLPFAESEGVLTDEDVFNNFK